MVAVFPSNAHGTNVDILPTFHNPDRSREEWAAMDADGEVKRKIMTERFG